MKKKGGKGVPPEAGGVARPMNKKIIRKIETVKSKPGFRRIRARKQMGYHGGHRGRRHYQYNKAHTDVHGWYHTIPRFFFLFFFFSILFLLAHIFSLYFYYVLLYFSPRPDYG